MTAQPPQTTLALPEETLARAINRITRSHKGDTYQNGVRPGQRKLEQFREVCRYRGVPELYAPKGEDAITFAFIKLFNPSGNWTWYITEFSLVSPDGIPDLAFGLVDGHEEEVGYFALGGEDGLAFVQGRFGIGIEVDMHFLPTPLDQIKKRIW